MKKISSILLLILLILPIAFAEISETVELSTGQIVKVGGKTTLLEKVNEYGQVVVRVDGIGGILSEYGQIKTINGAVITLGDINYINEETATATLTILVKNECGNNICEPTENVDVCCTDCGCLTDTCTENQCTPIKEDECFVDSDCDDNNESTSDLCEKTELQRICRYIKLAKHECLADKECNDNNPCTTDKCLLDVVNICAFTLITACTPKDNCCATNCDYLSDSDCKKICFNDADCNDHESCTIDKCVNQQCTINTNQGCNFENKCFPLKARKKIEGIQSYCDKNIWVAQKKESFPCNEGFGCISNKCADKKCAPQGFFSLLISFIRSILF